MLLVFLAALVHLLKAQPPDGEWNKWNYCDKDVKCKNKGEVHTVCERNHMCDPVKDCQERITDEFRDMMVKLHNEKRNFVALGRHTKNNVKPARNMRALSYDYSLEYTIRCHLNRCTGTEHDVCRGTKRWVQTTQNLCGHTVWDKKKSLDENIKMLSKLCVDLWFNESYYDGADFSTIMSSYDNLDVPQGVTGHFTTMVWGVTAYLGCHFSRDTIAKDHDEMGGKPGSNKGLYSFVGCNYAIGGNNEGRPIYQVGKACTRCPRGVKCNKEYKGLCGEIKYVADLSGSSSSAPYWISAVVIILVIGSAVGGFFLYRFLKNEDESEDEDE